MRMMTIVAVSALPALAACVSAPPRVANPFDPSAPGSVSRQTALAVGVVQTQNTRNAAKYLADFSRSPVADIRYAPRVAGLLTELDALLRSRFARVVPLEDPSGAAAAGVDAVLVVDAHADFPNLAFGTAKLELGYQLRSPAGSVL
jgi:hypothetical protein